MEINYYKPCPEYDRCCELIDRYWEAGEYEACFKGHLELAEQGYPLAECQVGWFYLKGQGVPQDDANAFYWTKRAAEHGDWDAQYNLASFYEEGAGVEKALSLPSSGTRAPRVRDMSWHGKGAGHLALRCGKQPNRKWRL